PKPPPPTHFLCIPLITPTSRPQLLQTLGAFRADIASPLSSFGGVPEDAIRPLGTLHLTLGIMSFPRNNNEGLDRAVGLLRSLRPREMLADVEEEGEGNSGSDLVITLQGLESMQAPAKAAVLYASPTDRLGTLQAFCERLRLAFREAELIVEESRPLLLHATILNTIYVKGGGGKKGGGGAGGKKKRERLTIDARGILDRYEDQVWMEGVKMEKIAICKMGAKKVEVNGVVEDEVYEVEAEIEF
ncbi:kinase A anchor protein, partial [Bombardia bombarda]